MKTKIRLPVYMLAAMAVCVLLLLLSSCIPRKMIQKQSEKSAEYFAKRQPFAVLIGDYINSIQDNYSDTLLCDIAYCIDTSHPLSSVLRANYAQGEYEEAYQGYFAAVNGREEPNREYGRYWHGSLVLIRPMLMVMSIGAIRILCGVIIMILQTIVVVILIRRKKTAFAICWLLALFLVHPWMLFTSLEYGTAFLAASVTSLVILLKKDITDTDTMPFFVVVGVVTCFVDFLTTETLTFTLPMLLLLAMRMSEGAGIGEAECEEAKSGEAKRKGANHRELKRGGVNRGGAKHINEVGFGYAKEECKSVIKNGLCWLAGYLAMFALKIGMLTIVAGVDVMKSSMSEGLLRLGGEVRTANISTAPVADIGQQFSGAIWHNLACLYPTNAGEMKATGPWLLTLLILAIGFAAVYLLHDRIDWVMFLPMGLVAVLPFLRFLVLSNHSYEHFFITYRAQMVTLAVFMFFVFENGIRQIMKTQKGAKRRR